jgi:hypothetical protein
MGNLSIGLDFVNFKKKPATDFDLLPSRYKWPMTEKAGLSNGLSCVAWYPIPFYSCAHLTSAPSFGSIPKKVPQIH